MQAQSIEFELTTPPDRVEIIALAADRYEFAVELPSDEDDDLPPTFSTRLGGFQIFFDDQGPDYLDGGWRRISILDLKRNVIVFCGFVHEQTQRCIIEKCNAGKWRGAFVEKWRPAFEAAAAVARAA